MSLKEVEEIKSYLHDCFIDVNTSTEAIDAFKQMCSMIEEAEKHMSIDDLLSLLLTSDNLKKALELIIKDRLDTIKRGCAWRILNETPFLILVRDYCDKNDITIVSEDEKADYTDEMLTSESTMNIYMREVRKIPMVSKEEELELGRRLLQNDEKARKRLIEGNLRWVCKVAQRYLNKGLDFEDLIQEGNAGLIKAADHFDINKGFRFTTYATWWIRQAIQRSLNNNSRTIRVPVHQHQLFLRYQTTIDKLRVELGREPSNEEIFQTMGIKKKAGEDLIKSFLDVVSLQTPIGDDKDTELVEFLAAEDYTPEEIAMEEAKKDEVKELLENSNLTYQQKVVLALRFGIGGHKPMSLAEIGIKLHLTRERIRQVEDKGLRKIRAYVKRKNSNPTRYIPKPAVEKVLKDDVIFDYFEGCDRKKVIQAFRNLTSDELYYINRRFNGEYKSLTAEEKQIAYKALQRVHAIVYGINNKEHEHSITIYSYFKKYSHQYVDVVLASLSESERNVIKDYFENVNDFENLDSDFYVKVVPKMKFRLSLLKTISQNNSVYDYYKKFGAEEVNWAINKLTSTEDKKFILEVFELNRLLTAEELLKVISTLDVLDIWLTKARTQSIYTYLCTFDNSDIDKALKSLSKSEQLFLDRCFTLGMQTDVDKQMFQEIIDKLTSYLSDIDNIPHKKKTSFYAHFPNKPYIIIKRAIQSLSEEDQDLIRRACGDNYDLHSYNPESLSLEEQYYLKNIIMKKIRNKLSNVNSLYEHFSDYTREDIDLVLNLLCEKDKILLVQKFGEDYCSPTFNAEASRRFGITLSRKIRKLLEIIIAGDDVKKSCIITRAQIIEGLEMANSENFETVFKDYELYQRLLFIYRYGLTDDQEYSVTSLGYIFGITNSEINSILRTMLLTVKEKLAELQPSEFSMKLLRSLINEKES